MVKCFCKKLFNKLNNLLKIFSENYQAKVYLVFVQQRFHEHQNYFLPINDKLKK